MSSIPAISDFERQELKELNEAFDQKVKLIAYSAAAASFLLIGALIVIGCSCLCLTLPGVNVINDVVLKAIVPSFFAILLSIPLILLAVKYNMDKNFIREQKIHKMVLLLDEYKVPEMERKMRTKFILRNLLNWQIDPKNPTKLNKNINWTSEYQGKILSDIKEIIGKKEKDQNPRQKRVALVLDKVRAKLNE